MAWVFHTVVHFYSIDLWAWRSMSQMILMRLVNLKRANQHFQLNPHFDFKCSTAIQMSIHITNWEISLWRIVLQLIYIFLIWTFGHQVFPLWFWFTTLDNLYESFMSLSNNYLSDDWLAIIVPAFQYYVSLNETQMEPYVTKYLFLSSKNNI